MEILRKQNTTPLPLDGETRTTLKEKRELHAAPSAFVASDGETSADVGAKPLSPSESTGLYEVKYPVLYFS